jgi:hypothetical protein
MEEYWGSRGKAPHSLDLGTRQRSVVSFTFRPLYLQGKSPWYPLDRRLGGPQNWSGHGGEGKNSQLLLGLEPPIIHTSCSPVLHCYKISYVNFGADSCMTLSQWYAFHRRKVQFQETNIRLVKNIYTTKLLTKPGKPWNDMWSSCPYL